MRNLGKKITEQRKNLGLTQSDFADKMYVTRQTVSRWEAGTVIPDVEKLKSISNLLQVSIDYLLDDELESFINHTNNTSSKILDSLIGKKVTFEFMEDDLVLDFNNVVCEVLEIEGNWMKIKALIKKQWVEKLMPISAISSIKIESEHE